MTNISDRTEEILPLRTAGSLPSSRTEGMLQEAIDNKNIDEVKIELEHVWSHYQSLEFALNREAKEPEYTIRAIKGMYGRELSEFTPEELIAITLRAVAGPVLNTAYGIAHEILPVMLARDISVPETLRLAYDTLDHTDPARQLSDKDIEAFLQALMNEGEDEAGEDKSA